VPSESRPPGLPPAERTVGQLVAEAVQLYRLRWRAALLVGIGPAALVVLLSGLEGLASLLVLLTAGNVLLSASYVGAVVAAYDLRPTRRELAVALAVAVTVFLPFPFLVRVYALPGIAWLALAGLAVPAALVERLPYGAALRRGFRLGRADYVHALGSLATLVILDGLTQLVLFLLLRGQADLAIATAAVVANLVVSPVVLLGAALLYADQEARAGARVRSQPKEA
jgi:hypothetical protein